MSPMNPSPAVLVERSFEVPLSAPEAWAALAEVEKWPAWAPHIAEAHITPPGTVAADTSGWFRFRPMGRSRFNMTDFDPPRSWTWSGRALGVDIDYEHHFESVATDTTRLRWRVLSRSRPGVRARLFGFVYSRLIDRAWPRFRTYAEGGVLRDE